MLKIFNADFGTSIVHQFTRAPQNAIEESNTSNWKIFPIPTEKINYYKRNTQYNKIY